MHLETSVAELLDELLTVQDEFLAVLAEKRDRMAATDLDGMRALQDREVQLHQRLQACQDRRADLLRRAAEQGLPSDNVMRLTTAITNGKPSPLRQQVQQASSRMQLLRHQSLTNWVIAQRTLLHLSHLLEIVATGGKKRPTYRKGTPAESRGSLVDQKV